MSLGVIIGWDSNKPQKKVSKMIREKIMRFLGETMFTMVIDAKLSNSNSGQGRSWHMSAKDRKEFAKLVPKSMVVVDDHDPVAFEDSLKGITLSDPVALIVTRVLGPRERLWDSDSVLRGNAKQVIDAVVATGLIADDGPKHVALTVGVQDDSRREQGPSIEISFLEVVKA